MENLDRLPKWAQEKIRGLQSRVETLTETLAMRNGEFAGGEVIVNPYNELTRLTFPDTMTVRFNLGERWEQYVDVRIVKDAVEIHCGGPMAIEPRVSNVVTVRPLD